MKVSDCGILNCSPDFFVINLSIISQVKGQLDDLIVIQVRDDLNNFRLPLKVLLAIDCLGIGILASLFNKELSQIGFLEIEGREVLLCDEILRAADWCPTILPQTPALNSEMLSGANNPVGLSTRKLKELTVLGILNLVSIAGVSDIFSCGNWWLQEDFKAFDVIKLVSDLVNQLGNLLLLEMLLPRQVVEG